MQRAVGHWIEGDAPLRKLSAWLDKGAVSLVESRNRLFQCPASVVRPRAFGTSDFMIVDKRLKVGDWVLARDDRRHDATLILARVNLVRGSKADVQAFSSLFWHFHGVVPEAVSELAHSIEPLWSTARPASDPRVIRRLVRFVSTRYRIGYHSSLSRSHPIRG